MRRASSLWLPHISTARKSASLGDIGLFMPEVYKSTCKIATNILAMHIYKESCSFRGMEKGPKPYKTYRDRVIEARKGIEVDGKELSQSQLAKDINTSPQAIQHLEDKKKAAQGSIYTVQIARRCAVDPYWLATGIGPKKGLSNEAAKLAEDWMTLDEESKTKAKEFIELRIKSQEMISELTHPRLERTLTETGKMRATNGRAKQT